MHQGPEWEPQQETQKVPGPGPEMDLKQKPGSRQEVQAVNMTKNWNEQKPQDYIRDLVSQIELLGMEALVFELQQERLIAGWQNEGRPRCGKTQMSH